MESYYNELRVEILKKLRNDISENDNEIKKIKDEIKDETVINKIKENPEYLNDLCHKLGLCINKIKKIKEICDYIDEDDDEDDYDDDEINDSIELCKKIQELISGMNINE
jgi:endonuclease III